MRSSLPETYETSTLGWRARILTSSSPVYPVAPTTPTLNFFAIFIALLLDFFIYLASHYYRQIYAICQKSCPPTPPPLKLRKGKAGLRLQEAVAAYTPY